MLIKDGVDSIIANRKKKLPLIEQKLKEIEEISLIVESVDSARRKMMQENMTGISSEVFESVKKINLSEYRKSLEALMAQYQEVINRFSRDEISISVVGAARQGKSKLLQSISSLDNSVIPAFDNNDCTGATSIIKNVSGASVSATITFRTELEMIEIIQAYLDVIGVSQKISSFAEIATIDLKNISEKMDDGSPNRAKFEHLSKYVEHFREWSPLIKESKKLIMEQKEIQKYVAQNNGESELSDTREDYYYYLAVKDIEIVCEFANADAGKIVLRDTIGLGDTSLGIEEKMLDAVGMCHCDAAVIVRRPEVKTGKFDETDNMIYKKLYDKFHNNNMEKWLFWLINQTSEKSGFGDNSDRCEVFKLKVKEQNWSIANAYVVDVADKQQVNDDFLIPMLEILIKNMDVIDKGIIQELNEQAEVLYGQYKKIQKEIQEILSIEVVREMDVNQFVDNIWKEFYERGFMKNLKDYMQEISLQKDKEFLVFTEKIQEIIRESPSLLPSEDELLNDLGAGGHNRPNEVLCKHMDCLRTNFTKQFLRLDELVLENFVKEFKCRIVDIFAEDGINCGRLKYICPYDEMAEKEKWFGLLVNCVFSKEEYEQLKTAFEVLDNFQISVRGFFMHRIRQGLDRLDPNNCNIEKYKNPEDNAWAILRELEVNLQKVCEELENILSTDELFKDPNKCLHAAMQEFYDRINFSYTGDGMVEIENRWKGLYRKNARKIWYSEFREQENLSGFYHEWDNIGKMLQQNQRENFILSI